jgi:NADPH-dependent ferric siderophore reductase
VDREETGVISTLTTFIARKGRRAWPLTVVEASSLTPRLTRVRFSGADLDALEYKPGQDVVLEIPHEGGIARRHYTIRRHEAGMLDIDFVLHGASPANAWVARAKPGDTLVAVGPRGHTYLREADWHLFVGDETCIPAIFAMLETLPPEARGHAILEIAEDADRLALDTPATIDWVSRGGAPPGPGRLLADRVEAFRFPPGRGQAYVIGETSTVRSIRHRLLERGLAKDQIAAEGYWRPGRVGGHDHV